MISKPLNKVFEINNDCNFLLSSYKTTTEIPVGKHLGAFGAVRKNHIHEGVDLYCEEGDAVFSMFRGTVVNILPFTGTIAGSPWWNNTYCVLVDHGDFVLNYGEIIPARNIKIGDFVESGAVIGFVEKVLKKDKGRPTSMLHLEKYVAGTTNVVYNKGVWELGDRKPEGLLDPTDILFDLL